MGNSVDEKELMEIMRELEKIKQQNSDFFANIVDINETKDNLIENATNSFVGREEKEEKNISSSESLSLVNDVTNANYSNTHYKGLKEEEKILAMLENMLSLMDTEFSFLKKENEQYKKIFLFLVKLSSLLINNIKNLNENIKSIKESYHKLENIVEKELDKNRNLTEELIKKIEKVHLVVEEIEEYSKRLYLRNGDKEDLEKKINALIEINKKVSDDLAEKVFKLEKNIVLLVEILDEIRLFLKVQK